MAGCLATSSAGADGLSILGGRQLPIVFPAAGKDTCSGVASAKCAEKNRKDVGPVSVRE